MDPSPHLKHIMAGSPVSEPRSADSRLSVGPHTNFDGVLHQGAQRAAHPCIGCLRWVVRNPGLAK